MSTRDDDNTLEQPANAGCGAAPCSALAAVDAEWRRWRRPDRTVQFATVIHAESPKEVAEELEYMAMKIRDGYLTEGSGGGPRQNFAWSTRLTPNRRVAV